MIGISQSGETADTLAAMRLARDRGARVLAITNILGSQATRDSDGVLYTRAGLEIGVAATKTFVAQVAAMYLLGLKLAELRHALAPERAPRADHRAEGDPAARSRRRCRPSTSRSRGIARPTTTKFFLYLGRHIGLPVCLEGALKLKEISYIPADAYAAGEMKHGPIALLDESTPVVCVATDSPVLGQGPLQRRRGEGARRRRDRRRDRGLRARRRSRGPHDLRSPYRLDASAAARGAAASAARVPHRAPARPQRGPAT